MRLVYIVAVAAVCSTSVGLGCSMLTGTDSSGLRVVASRRFVEVGIALGSVAIALLLVCEVRRGRVIQSPVILMFFCMLLVIFGMILLAMLL